MLAAIGHTEGARRSKGIAMHATAAALLALALVPAAAAATETPQTLQGMFCSSEAQLDQALRLMVDGVSVELTLSALNTNGQACTLIDQIGYVVDAPVTLGRSTDGVRFKYRASLVAVRIGTGVRPVEPPVAVFFFRDTPLPGAGEQT
jgi:hypothetical protein